MGHIFISYSRNDKDYVGKLHESLESEGFKVWRDVHDIDYGSEWLTVIEKNLDECEAFIIVMSRNSSESDLVQKEAERARIKKKKIFPLLLDGDNWFAFQTTQYADVRDSSLPTEKFYDQLRPYALSDVNAELNTELSIPITKSGVTKMIMKIKAIIEDINDYPLAKERAELYKPPAEKYGNIPKLQLLNVWYAHALMYIGDTGKALDVLNQAIDELKKIEPSESDDDHPIWCEALGRAHNHIGYISWVDFGCLEIAGKEFLEAIGYFLRLNTGLESEIATAYDNFGRIYSQLGYSTYAEIIIDNGKQFRDKLNDEARIPLSLDSMAVAYLDAGQPNRALNFSEESFSLFQEFYKKTGKGSRRIGLALLTKGRALRRLGSLDYTGETHKTNSYKENLELLDRAEKAFNGAKDKFELAQERLRLYQVDNELACVFREQAKIFKKMGKGDKNQWIEEIIEEHIKNSLQHLGVASDVENNKDEQIDAYVKNIFTHLDKVKMEDKLKYRLFILDTCEDLARAWFIVGKNLTRVENLINTALENIPKEYDIRDIHFSKTGIKIHTEEYWQQIGKLYVLLGELYFKNEWRKSIGNYILATAYFSLFRERNEKTNTFPVFRPELASHRALTEKIYDDLQTLSQKELKILREEELVNFEKTNPQISVIWCQDFRDILGLVCLVKNP